MEYDYDASTTPTATVAKGDRVRINGKVYEYVGSTTLTGVTLATQDYTDLDLWHQVTALQQDYGDATLWERVDLLPASAQVRAYVVDSSIDATGSLTVRATEQATIDAIVIAAAVALSGGVVGVSLGGAGAAALNRIATEVKAYIDGDGPSGIRASSVLITATDSSGINAIAGAAAIAAGFGVVGVAVSIAVTIAFNQVANDVAAYLANADQGLTTTAGAFTVTATSAGLYLFDLTGFSPSQLDDAGVADADDNGTSTDEAAADRTGDALVISQLTAAFTGAGLVLPIVNTVSTSWKYTSEDGSETLETGDLVKLAVGYSGCGTDCGTGGAIYRYTGSGGSLDLSTQDYTTGPWEVYTASSKLSVLTPGEQWVLAAPDGAAYVLTYDAATGKLKVSRSTINVVAAAASVAIGGGLVGVGVAGAGSVAFNSVLSTTNAGISNSKVTTTSGATTPGDVSVSATSTKGITAIIASVAVGVGGGLVGVGAGIGVAISRNYIGWRIDGSAAPSEVRATIIHSTFSAAGALRVAATDSAQISALVFSAAVGLGGGARRGRRRRLRCQRRQPDQDVRPGGDRRRRRTGRHPHRHHRDVDHDHGERHLDDQRLRRRSRLVDRCRCGRRRHLDRGRAGPQRDLQHRRGVGVERLEPHLDVRRHHRRGERPHQDPCDHRSSRGGGVGWPGRARRSPAPGPTRRIRS